MRYSITTFLVLACSCVVSGAQPEYVLTNGEVKLSTGESYEPPVPVQAQTAPVRNPVLTATIPVRTAVTKMVQVCTFDAFGNKTSCRVVPQTEYVEVPEAVAGMSGRVVSNAPRLLTATDVCPCGCNLAGCNCGMAAETSTVPTVRAGAVFTGRPVLFGNRPVRSFFARLFGR